MCILYIDKQTENKTQIKELKMKVSEFTTKNFEAISMNLLSAKEMALRPHNLSQDAKYARETNGNLWIWSDSRNSWVQIDAN